MGSKRLGFVTVRVRHNSKDRVNHIVCGLLSDVCMNWALFAEMPLVALRG
jgi:hypothetical protein